MDDSSKINNLINCCDKEFQDKIKEKIEFTDNRDDNKLLKEIKRELLFYYLEKYPFKTYYSNKFYDELLFLIKDYHSFSKKIVLQEGNLKIYPISFTHKEHEEKYHQLIEEMIDYQITYSVPIEKTIKSFTLKYKEVLEEYKKKLNETPMLPFYGSPEYIINRAKFIRDCINENPFISINIDELIEKMDEFSDKYFNNNILDLKNIINTDYYADYDKLEKYYLEILRIEKELVPMVVNYWKEYLTNPKEHDDNSYKYVMHTFSGNIVSPEAMNKACCTLNTEELVITPYGSWGLIYDLDASAIDTMCCSDAGSWTCTKREFIDRGCPESWQLTNPEVLSVWYENEKNSKLIMPERIENECKNNNIRCNGEVLNYDKYLSYSEIFLKKDAKAIGVFYTDKCQNIEEIEKYAKEHNLPLVNISLIKQRGLKKLQISI